MLAYTDQLYSGTASASSNTHSTPTLTRYVREATFFLDITAVTGTNPTLDVTIHEYDRIGGNWHLLATFTQKTGIGTDVGRVQYGLGDKVAVDYAIGGTNSPSFTFQLNATFKEG